MIWALFWAISMWGIANLLDLWAWGGCAEEYLFLGLLLKLWVVFCFVVHLDLHGPTAWPFSLARRGWCLDWDQRRQIEILALTSLGLQV